MLFNFKKIKTYSGQIKTIFTQIQMYFCLFDCKKIHFEQFYSERLNLIKTSNQQQNNILLIFLTNSLNKTMHSLDHSSLALFNQVELSENRYLSFYFVNYCYFPKQILLQNIRTIFLLQIFLLQTEAQSQIPNIATKFIKMKEIEKINQTQHFEPEKQSNSFDFPLNTNDYNYQYFKEMQNIRLYRNQIQKKMEELNRKRNKIYDRVIFFEKKTQQQFRDYIRGEAPQRKKRNRRNADEIQRQYNCPTCGKKYGSQGSMHQHIKLKHPKSYQPKKRNQKQEGSQQQFDSR